MKKKRLFFLAMVLALMLCACGSGGDIPETTTPTEAQPEETESSALDDMQLSAPQPGYYLISSVGKDGDMTLYGYPDPTNGYLKLEEDFTGVMCFDDVERKLTWDEESITWGEEILPCVYVSYYDSELGVVDSILMVYMLEDETSIAFRAAEESDSQ